MRRHIIDPSFQEKNDTHSEFMADKFASIAAN
jgi:hypothetical protein